MQKIELDKFKTVTHMPKDVPDFPEMSAKKTKIFAIELFIREHWFFVFFTSLSIDYKKINHLLCLDSETQ